jgi:hypothetical protein
MGSDAIRAFFAHSSTGQVLGTRIYDRRQNHRSGGKLGQNPPEDSFVTFLRTKTWVTAASDYPTYDIEGFKSASLALKTFKVSESRNLQFES